MAVEETVPKVPNMALAQLRFAMAHAATPQEKTAAQQQLMAAITADSACFHGNTIIVMRSSYRYGAAVRIGRG